MLDEKQVSRFPGISEEGHAGLSGCSIPLLGVALRTGADEVFPRVLSSSVFRDDVVHGHWAFVCAAVLALVTVSFDDGFPVQEYPFPRNVDHPTKAYDAGEGDGRADRVDVLVVPLDHLGLLQIEQDDRPLGAAHAHGFVVLVQN